MFRSTKTSANLFHAFTSPCVAPLINLNVKICTSDLIPEHLKPTSYPIHLAPAQAEGSPTCALHTDTQPHQMSVTSAAAPHPSHHAP
jgi:lysophospholipase